MIIWCSEESSTWTLHLEKWKIHELSVTSNLKTYILGPPWSLPRKETLPQKFNSVLVLQSAVSQNAWQAMFGPIFIHFATITGFWIQHEILLVLLILELNCLLQLIWIISCDKLGPSLCSNWTALFSGSVGALQGQGLPGAGNITWCPLHLVPLVFLATSSWDSFLLPGATVAWHQEQCPMAPHLAIVPFSTNTDWNSL